MRSLSGCSRPVFPIVDFSLCQSAVFVLLLVDHTTRHRATRQSRAVRFERLAFGYYCSAAAKNRLACAENCCLALGFKPYGCMPDLI